LRAFDYRAPSTVGEAVALLAEKGDRARPFAGGTDILVQVRAGRLDLDLLVDVKRIPELSQLAYDPATGLTVGAAVPCHRIYEDPQIREAFPGLVDSAAIIGGTGIQGRATLGGNLCNSSPSADSIPALIVLGATCAIVGPSGARTVPVERFCTGPGRNVLAPGEMLVSIHLPPPKPRSGARYLRFIPRNEMDIAVVGVGASVVLSEDLARITAARIALGAVAPTPLLAEDAGASLVGKPPSEETIAEAAALAREAARPITDVRGTAAQRRHLVGVLAKRALRGAIQRAGGSTGNHS